MGIPTLGHPAAIDGEGAMLPNPTFDNLVCLTRAHVDHFLTRGWVAVPDCFSADAAEQVRARWIAEQSLDPDHPESWGFAMTHRSLRQGLDAATFAPKALAAVEDLVGRGRVREPWNWTGFIVNVSIGRDRPWSMPGVGQGWHVDGDWYQHFLDGPEQGLLTLEYFNDVGSHSGGTVVCEGSQSYVAELLAEHPEGLTPSEFMRLSMERIPFGDLPKTEITGPVGTVVLCHPFLLHASSPNTDGPPRFAFNASVTLTEPNRFDRIEGASVVERSIQSVFGKPFEFKATGPRTHYSPDRSKYERKAATTASIGAT